MRGSDVAYLDTMNEVLEMTAQFVEEARQSEDDARLGVYLRMASRCMRCALEMYGEHLRKTCEFNKEKRVVQKYKVTLILTAEGYMDLAPLLGIA